MDYDVLPAPGYHPEIGLLLAGLDDSTREWRGELGSPPVEAIVWQPWQDGYSIGSLMLHMIDCELGWFEQFAAGMPSDAEEAKLLMSAEIKQDDGIWPTPPAEPIEWYFDLHESVRQRVRQPLKSMNPEEVHAGRENRFTLRWIVAHVLQHDSYHGGQAVMLHEMWKATK